MVSICKWWLKGTCRYGEQCRYIHENVATGSTTPALPTDSLPINRTSGERKKRSYHKFKMMRDTGILLGSFELSKIQKPTTLVEIRDIEFIASYNWSDSAEPAIFVPGCPARWTPPKLPYQVAEDKGQVFVDQNSHRSQLGSFDPFFKALLTMCPKFNMNSIELTTDRNSLRKLLQFVSGKVASSWRIDVDVIEDTMFFTRWEPNQVQLITGSRNSGYGHEFEKAYLTFDSNMHESSGHHRIVQYTLGGIKCLVRYEADGYIDDGPGIDNPILLHTLEKLENQPSAADELSQALSDLHIEKITTVFSSFPPGEVKVIERGDLVNYDAIIELKSRSGVPKIQDMIPQLWISQTYHLFVCRHRRGLVDAEPERLNMTEHFPAWEMRNQHHLSALVGLITEVKEGVKKVQGGKCTLVFNLEEKPRALRLYRRKGRNLFVPKGARERCWEK